MTTQAEHLNEERRRCWCCDEEFPPALLVSLGAHPEVALCFDCARWIGRRARQQADLVRPGLRARVRRSVAGLRAAVISRGWHDLPVVGRILRRIDRRLP
ncbi:hypothetical protein GCM10011584_03870 [Nocardioides phosphati]|uniref:ClpX-type ZB domain-containing protein n=1 Tax=Nocardioides phosphati TaxID=1867775 RepID=A0ABQ2N6I1_9ACTN|nr:hypothetical protein GCM10011584_03870 [Nocardioides phosphati]